MIGRVHMGNAKTRTKQVLDVDVYSKTLQRIEYLYRKFDKVVVSFSGGKDSTAALHCTIEVARKLNKLPVEVLFFDEEAIHPPTIEYVERVRALPEVNMKWFCLPIKHRNACSNTEPWWYTWDPSKRELWTRELPERVITSHPRFEPGKDDISSFVPKYYTNDHGDVCVITGIRSQESIRRYRIVANKRNDNYITVHPFNKNVYNAHPIYDWSSEDVWILVKEKGIDYNRTYDIFDKTKLNGQYLKQRVCPPYGEEPLRGLWIYAECFPDMFEKMLARVPGVSTAWRYSNTELYGVALDQPPAGHNWHSYSKVLLQNYDGQTRFTIQQNINSMVELHYKKSKLRIKDDVPDPITGCCWKFLCKAIFRGDLKGRTRQSMEKGSDKTRADQGITLEEAIRLYATETYKKEWYAKNSQTASK